MSETIVVNLITNFPLTLTAVAALIVAIMNYRVSRSTHTLSNSKLTKVEDKLEVALGRIGQLEEMLKHEKRRRGSS